LIITLHPRNLIFYEFFFLQKRNKPKDPPKVPEAAPFFLPTIAGLDPVFDVEAAKKTVENQVDIKRLLNNSSPFAYLLLECHENGNEYQPFLKTLKEMPPSKIDVELRCLSDVLLTQDDEQVITDSLDERRAKPLLLVYFLDAMAYGLKLRRDYELIVSYTSLFLRIHSETLFREGQLCRNPCKELNKVIKETWTDIESSMNENLSIINFLRSFVA